MTPPTKRQQDALRFIRGYQLAKGYSPSVKEIARGLGGNSHGSTWEKLRGLEERGHIYRLPNRNRAVAVLTDIAVPRAPDGAPLYFVAIGR